jgi:hypothetical protein
MKVFDLGGAQEWYDECLVRGKTNAALVKRIALMDAQIVEHDAQLLAAQSRSKSVGSSRRCRDKAALDVAKKLKRKKVYRNVLNLLKNSSDDTSEVWSMESKIADMKACVPTLDTEAMLSAGNPYATWIAYKIIHVVNVDFAKFKAPPRLGKRKREETCFSSPTCCDPEEKRKGTNKLRNYMATAVILYAHACYLICSGLCTVCCVLCAMSYV